MNPYARRRDQNARIIVSVLRQAGAWVYDADWIGRGVPDKFVVCPDVTTGELRFYLVEIKADQGKLTEAEAEFIRDCPYPVYVIRTPDEALAMIDRSV